MSRVITAPSTSSSRGVLRALHVYATLSRGGAETWLMDVVRRAGRNDLAIDVCLVGRGVGPYEEEFQSLGGTIHRCPLGKNPLRFTREFARLLREHPYDVVHSHLYLFSGVVLRTAYRVGVPRRIAHIHPVEDFKEKRLLRGMYARWMRSWIIRYGTHFASPSREGWFRFWGPDWERDDNKRVIYNGLDVSRFEQAADPDGVREELGIPKDAKLVLNVARFAPHKRHAFLVDVAERLIGRDRNVYFLFIGAGDLRDEAMAKASEAGLDANVRFVAGAPDINRYWLAADAFAFPSVNEGFGIVVAEAAAAGLPVVAQDIPGVREAATSCHDVTLLPVDTDPEAWSRTLEEAVAKGRLSDDDRRQRLKSFPFTIERSIEALRGLYGLSPKPPEAGS